MDAKHLNNQEKLDHMFEMVVELNEEMHHLKKKEAVTAAFRYFYMAVIVMALGGAYYFLMPFFNTLKKAPELIDAGMNSLDQLKQAVPHPGTVENVINDLKKTGASQETLLQAQKLLEQAKALRVSTSSH